MASLIVGHTGYVGGTLMRGRPFDLAVNSKTAPLLRSCRPEVDLAVCCGAPAVKWKANKEPQADLAAIDDVWESLSAVRAERFLLVSTVDVHPDPACGADESFDPSGLPNHAYGRHRLLLEERVRDRWPSALILRLPALFGDGLKKNALFDLLTRNESSPVRPDGVFQWYGLSRLWSDIDAAFQAGLTLANLVPEPISMAAIAARCFPDAVLAEPGPTPAGRYDLKTRHAEVFGGRAGRIEAAAESLDAIAAWVDSARGEHAA